MAEDGFEHVNPAEVEFDRLPGAPQKRSAKHLGAGLRDGLTSAVGGVAAGAAALVVAPVLGAKEGGAAGFAKGLATGVFFSVALPVLGVASAVGSIGDGVANTPAACVAAAEGKEWDAATSTWILYDLGADAEAYLGAEADAALREHVRRRRESARESAAEAGAAEGAGAGAAGARVKDASLYEALGVPPSASDAQIKKAYYKTSLRCHPDKHPGDAAKTEQFQSASAAYAVLSEPDARRRYDATGEVDERAAAADPAVFFSMIFGSEEFEKYVGELQMAQMVKGPDVDGTPDGAELAFRQRRRAVRLATTLRDILAPLVDGSVDKPAFVAEQESVAAALCATPFGATLVKVIARAYVASANAYVGGGLGAAIQGVFDSAHTANNAYKAARETVALVSTSRSLDAAARAAEATKEAGGGAERCLDGGAQLAAAAAVVVSDRRGAWVVSHFAGFAAASSHFANLSYAYASVLFERTEGGAWAAARNYGTPSSCARIKDRVAALPENAVPTMRAVRDAVLRGKQGRLAAAVGEAAWRMSVLDMESTLRDATAKLFKDTAVDEATREKRARALKALAKAWLAAARRAGHTETWQESLAAQLSNGGAPPPPEPEEEAAAAPRPAAAARPDVEA